MGNKGSRHRKDKKSNSAAADGGVGSKGVDSVSASVPSFPADSTVDIPPPPSKEVIPLGSGPPIGSTDPSQRPEEDTSPLATVGDLGNDLVTDVKTSPNRDKDKDQLVREAKEEFHQANNYFREARYEQAKLAYLSAMDKLKYCEEEAKEHNEAILLSHLGVLEFAEGRSEEARRLLTEAVQRYRSQMAKPIDANNPYQFNLTSLAIAMKKDIALQQLPQSEQTRIAELREHGTLDAMVADVLNNLGACHEVMGQLEDARKMYEDSMELRKMVFGEKSLKVAESMQNLATIFDSQGKLQDAETLLREALAIEIDVLGENNVETTVTMNNLGVLNTHLGRLDTAEKLLQQSVDIRRHVYGDHHHLTMCASQNLEYVQHKVKTIANIAKDFDDNQALADSTI